MIGRRRFARDRFGRFKTGLGPSERELLKALPGQAQGLLEVRDPSAARVFPVAYPEDPKAESDYREMTGEHLLRRHQHALDTLAATVDEPSIDEEEINLWLDALEVLRLVLGTQLDVTEDVIVVEDSDPRAPQVAVYRYLSMLQGEIVDSLAEALPVDGIPGDPGDPGDPGEAL
ncbi:MAG TPA: DUF2017 family protein [Acidimicrobiales bacterium]|nr:DUF2017 family protein [Acidimicrobiales bacterium]